MRTLGIYNSDGQPQTRLRNQMKRLFGCSVSLTYEGKHDDRSLWDSKIELGEKLFNEIIQHPVPLDMNILATLKRSALGLDFYLWLTYRVFNRNYA